MRQQKFAMAVLCLLLLVAAGCDREPEKRKLPPVNTNALAKEQPVTENGQADTGKANPWYLETSVSKACERAKEEDKIVVVACMSQMCPACGVLETQVLIRPEVVEFLHEYTIPVAIDLNQNMQFGMSYQVQGTPTLLFMKPDGTEIERIVGGGSSPDVFLDYARFYVRGYNDIEIARSRAVLAHSDLARAMAEKGYTQYAVAEYKRAIRVCREGSDIVVQDYGSSAVQGLAWLAQDNTEARKAIKDVAEETASRLRSDKPARKDFRLLVLVCLEMDQPQLALDIFDQLRSQISDEGELAEYAEIGFDLLLEAGRYEELAELTDVDKKLDLLWTRRNEPKKEDYPEEEHWTVYPRDKADYNRFFREQVSRYYQLFIGAGREEKAAALAEKFLAQYPGSQTLNELAWAGYLTGKPTETNLQQARDAYEKTNKKDMGIVDTLARIMALHGQCDEAAEIVKEAIDTCRKQPQLFYPGTDSMLKQCLSDIRDIQKKEKAQTEKDEAPAEEVKSEESDAS